MSEPVYATYFTDPLCSWSWAFEASWRRLLSEFGDLLRYRYRMGGLLADWRRYQDPINNIRRPSQMAPQWVEVQQQTGVPVNPELWHRNPPASSYPACIAYKAAEAVRLDFAEHYLRRLREAAILNARDISDRNVLLAIAEETGREFPADEEISQDDFVAAFESSEAESAFREDLKEVRYLEIGRFPTVIFHRPNGRGLALTGYRPYAALREGFARFAPELAAPAQTPPPLDRETLPAYVMRWKSVTLQELMENFALPREVLGSEIQRLGLSRNITAERTSSSERPKRADGSLGWEDFGYANSMDSRSPQTPSAGTR